MDEAVKVDWQAAMVELQHKMSQRATYTEGLRQDFGPDDVSLSVAHERRWDLAIPLRYRHARIADLSGDLAEASAWDGSRNVLLLGNVGTGKTHAAVALARTVHDKGRTVLFKSALGLVDDLKPGGDEKVLSAALTVDLLLLDDLGYERRTDFSADRVSRVITDRYDACLPTIVTSNLAPDVLAAEVGPRLWSRLFDGALRLKVSGEDRRGVA